MQRLAALHERQSVPDFPGSLNGDTEQA